ncbi:MAG: O-antigen ligase domain-containing protein [Planctomycetes bacterium]|nr:O-antigen ligase domain-containing protein [Planctomycetota bacterium]
MNSLGTLVLLAWLPLVLAVFGSLPARRAVIAAYLVGWMFLPVAGLSLPGPLDWNKLNAVNLSALLGILIFDARRLAQVRFGLFDLPIAIWCLCPFATVISNDLGTYDAFAQTLNQTVAWGIPYLVGRCYFSNADHARELAIGLVIGGLIYAPLCLWEARMSPQLHAIVYGFHQHSFEQSVRGTTYRPTVFMHHGLMVSMWMAVSALIGAALWLRGNVRAIGPLPMPAVALVIIAATVMCKSLGALLLLGAGLGTLLLLGRAFGRLPLLLLIGAPLLYVACRIEGLWTGETVVELTRSVSEDRAASLQYRLDSERFLIARAWERPWLGWAGYGRNNTYYDEHDEYIDVIVDGLWILTFGQLGLIGLGSLTLALLLPVLAFARRVRPALWSQKRTIAVGALALIPPLFLVDSLFNAMMNPLYLLVAGGLSRLTLSEATAPRTKRSLQRTPRRSLAQQLRERCAEREGVEA